MVILSLLPQTHCWSLEFCRCKVWKPSPHKQVRFTLVLSVACGLGRHSWEHLGCPGLQALCAATSGKQCSKSTTHLWHKVQQISYPSQAHNAALATHLWHIVQQVSYPSLAPAGQATSVECQHFIKITYVKVSKTNISCYLNIINWSGNVSANLFTLILVRALWDLNWQSTLLIVGKHFINKLLDCLRVLTLWAWALIFNSNPQVHTNLKYFQKS